MRLAHKMILLKVCFVGVGSIAKRHIRNLIEICDERNIQVIIDAFRRNATIPKGVNHVYTDISDVPSDYDVIFITNPTSLHLLYLELFLCKGRNFFIEKPVVAIDQIDKARRLKPQKESLLYVACPLRYNAVIQWIKNNISSESVISVRSISSSYLPDWRPGQDYRKTYSSTKELGGGVSIDLIHEWDYLTYLFGWPDRVFSLIGKKSNLEIDSDDYAIYIAEYADKIMELHLDYFGRKPIRDIQLFTKDDTIECDLINNRIKRFQSGTVIEFCNDRDDQQKKELSCFLDMLYGITPAVSGYAHGLDVLELTQGVLHENIIHDMR